MKYHGMLIGLIANSLLALSCCLPARGGDTFTSAEEAGVIFQLQGEYYGSIEGWGGTWGAQVIATGKDSLAIHLLEGGLPGQGFEGREPTKVLDAKIDLDKSVAESSKDEFKVAIKPDTLSVMDESGKTLGVLTKITRESVTQGSRPGPTGTFLFDLAGTNDFTGAKPAEQGLLGVGGTSAELFEDHTLHIEFRTPFQPEDSGQQRGNSGVYVQGRYEVQVLDSFGLRGEDNECGGIYQVARPSINMCYPPLSWQTYDIEFTAAKYEAETSKKISNARITIKHNGVVIHDNLELPRATPGKDQESNTAGPLFLQDHGNPVVYRNIWIKGKKGIKGKGPVIEAQAN